jgi:septal ring factor EnvC (AmiA/AmiB activator)
MASQASAPFRGSDISTMMETWAQGSEFQQALKAKDERIKQLEKQVQEFARMVKQLSTEID